MKYKKGDIVYMTFFGNYTKTKCKIKKVHKHLNLYTIEEIPKITEGVSESYLSDTID